MPKSMRSVWVERRLQLKDAPIGCWVDGACGYWFSQHYHDTRTAAIREAVRMLRETK